MEETTDSEIWAQILASDARSFGVVWDRHRDRIFRKLVTLGCSHVDAEDLTAATFFESWRRRRSVRFVDGSLLPWMLLTAHNLSRNAARARRRYRALLDRLPAPENAPDPADMVAEQNPADARLVRELLATAREADRHLLALTTLDGLTIREAALAIGVSESAAKMRLSRLRRRLSDTLASVAHLEGEVP